MFSPNKNSQGESLLLNIAPLKNIVPYSIYFASIIKTKEVFFNKSIEIIFHDMYKVAMDTTPKPLKKF